ncbi:MAG: PrsW family intramembrane metalloprotease [Kiritimatiellae bacterium]|nr:PrsW family intramembrane metalloprotease [Kiritimatiellia bacterium]
MENNQLDDPISTRLNAYRVNSGGQEVAKRVNPPSSSMNYSDETASENNAGSMARKLGGKISDIAGVEKLERFNLGEFVSDIFRSHSTDEVENYFTVGTPATIPDISLVDTGWPRPWLFTRSLIGAGLIYFLFSCAIGWFKNPNLLPGLIAMGTIAIPCSTLIFFIEVNARRNVSLYQVLRFVLFGGILSLIFSLVLFALPVTGAFSWLGASIAGIVEETGKLAAVIVMGGSIKYRYKLNGLLLGAAVGTGFAVFESMGYALRILLSGGLDAMTSNILLRGVLSPFGHIVWTAITAAALWRVKGAAKFSFQMLKDIKFLRLFFVPVVLHMIWNSGFELPFCAVQFAVGAVAWLIVFALIQEGLKELREEKRGLR